MAARYAKSAAVCYAYVAFVCLGTNELLLLADRHTLHQLASNTTLFAPRCEVGVIGPILLLDAPEFVRILPV